MPASLFDDYGLRRQLCISDVSESVTLVRKEGHVFGHEEADVSMISYVKMCIN